VTENKLDGSVISIEREEIPSAYGLLINDPILKAYKYVQVPHTAQRPRNLITVNLRPVRR